MPDLKTTVANKMKEQYPQQGTILDKMKYLVRFAVPLMSKQLSPAVEETMYSYYESLAQEIVKLNPEQRAELGKDWANFISEKMQSTVNQLNNAQDKENIQLNEDAVVVNNMGFFLSILRSCDERTLSDEFVTANQTTQKENLKRAWVPENTPPDQAAKLYEEKYAPVESIITTNYKGLEKVTGISGNTVKKALYDAQKQANNTLSPDISSMRVYSQEMQAHMDALDPNLPGNPEPIRNILNEYVTYVKDHAETDLLVESDEVKQVSDGMKDIRNKLRRQLDDYLKSIDRNALTPEHQNALMTLDDVVQPLLGEYYAEYRHDIVVTQPGYQVYGKDDFHVKPGKYGAYVHSKAEGVWVDEYQLSHTKTTPQSVTLSDGRQGLIYENDTFNLKEELQKVCDEIGKRRPELKPYLKLNDTAINQVMTAQIEDPAALKDFIFAFHPGNTIGDNGKFKIPLAAQTIEKYFLPGPGKKRLDEQPAFAEEIDGLYEEFYGLANTQNELMYGHLLDKDGVALPMNGIHDAMGEVADLLGVSEMVAPSSRVPIVRDGKTVFVNFTEPVQGKSIMDPEQDNIFLDRNNNPLMKPDALKALADMQVLDYLCGTEYYNMDSDVVFRTDPQDPTKITGIVRNNAGNSFGTINPDLGADGKRMDLTPSASISSDKLMVVNAATAEKIMAMTPEDITRIMENKAFRPEQIEAAKLRLQQLQQKLQNPSPDIRSGSIHIMTDEEWRSKSPDELMRDLVMDDQDKERYATADEETKKQLTNKLSVKEERANDNIFRKLYGVRDKAKNAVAMDKQVNGKTHPSMAHKIGFGGTVKVAQSLSVSMTEMLKELERNDPWYVPSSRQFSEMKAAVKDYVKTFAEMSKRWKQTGDKTPEDMKKLAEKMKVVGEKANAYRLSKDRDGVKGRTGPGRYAFARQLEQYAGAFEKEISRNPYRSANDRRIDNVREYYGEKGLNPDLLPHLKEKRVVVEGQENILKPLEVPQTGVGLKENDFAYLAYTTVFDPNISGSVRKRDVGIRDAELSPEENVACHSTFFTRDLSMDSDPSRKGEFMPRPDVGRYFGTIQNARETVAFGLKQASEGKPAALGGFLARGLEEYREYFLDNCNDPTGEVSLMDARMMKGTLDFLERNPAVMEEAKRAGLKPETILKVKAKANYAELYDRSDSAKRRLKRDEEGKEPLTDKQRRECQRDITAYDMVKTQAKAEVEQRTGTQEYQEMVTNQSMQMQNKLVEVSKSPEAQQDPKIYAKQQLLLNAKFDIACSKGIGMPTAILNLAKGIGEVQRQAEAQMNQPQNQPQPVQQGGPQVPV